MATEKQILANRRNAQLSTGPRTPEGKSVSRLNALRHGLTGQIHVRTPEDHQAHHEFCAAIIASLQPEGAIEDQFAHSIAEDHWRLNRARSLENNIFAITASLQNSDGETEVSGLEVSGLEVSNLEVSCLEVSVEASDLDTALAEARTYIADPGRLNLLSLYERRIHGNMTRSLKQLKDLQTQRRNDEAESAAGRAKAIEEEILLAQLAEAEGVQYVPTSNGFGFSTPEILSAAHRQSRLAAARRLQATPRPSPIRKAA